MQETITHTLSDYGVLGIAVLVLGYITWYNWRVLLQKNKELEKRVDELQHNMTVYLENDRNTLLQALNHNTQAFIELKDIIHGINNASRVKGRPKGSL